MAKMGRPPVNIDPGKLDGMLMFGATCLECANEFNCDEQAVVRFVKRNYQTTFKEYSHKKHGATRIRLRQKQIELAMKGNITMLIWLGKQMLGQSDKVEEVNKDSKPVRLIIERPKEYEKQESVV